MYSLYTHYLLYQIFRTPHYEDIGPDHEANHYETLEMSR
jgi:hypothetical protein